MSEEELERARGIIKRLYAGTGITFGDIVDTAPWLDKLVNEVEDLQKENGKLKKELETFNGLKNGTTIMFGAKTQYWRKDKIEKYFISKDIIRTKIKELEEELVQNYGTLGESLTTSEIKVLKELLGE